MSGLVSIPGISYYKREVIGFACFFCTFNIQISHSREFKSYDIPVAYFYIFW